MIETLRNLVEAEKSIATSVDWTKRGRRLELKLPLEIDGLIEEGFFLRATALEHFPDQDVMLQLEYHGIRISGGLGPLMRMEWNSLRPHNNKGRGPPELRFIEQIPSHVHYFDDNWNDQDGALLRDNLPIARPVSEPIQGFMDCIDFAGNLFNINNIRLIKVPEWVLEFDLRDGL